MIFTKQDLSKIHKFIVSTGIKDSELFESILEGTATSNKEVLSKLEEVLEQLKQLGSSEASDELLKPEGGSTVISKKEDLMSLPALTVTKIADGDLINHGLTLKSVWAGGLAVSDGYAVIGFNGGYIAVFDVADGFTPINIFQLNDGVNHLNTTNATNYYVSGSKMPVMISSRCESWMEEEEDEEGKEETYFYAYLPSTTKTDTLSIYDEAGYPPMMVGITGSPLISISSELINSCMDMLIDRATNNVYVIYNSNKWPMSYGSTLSGRRDTFCCRLAIAKLKVKASSIVEACIEKAVYPGNTTNVNPTTISIKDIEGATTVVDRFCLQNPSETWQVDYQGSTVCNGILYVTCSSHTGSSSTIDRNGYLSMYNLATHEWLGSVNLNELIGITTDSDTVYTEIEGISIVNENDETIIYLNFHVGGGTNTGDYIVYKLTSNDLSKALKKASTVASNMTN